MFNKMKCFFLGHQFVQQSDTFKFIKFLDFGSSLFGRYAFCMRCDGYKKLRELQEDNFDNSDTIKIKNEVSQLF